MDKLSLKLIHWGFKLNVLVKEAKWAKVTSELAQHRLLTARIRKYNFEKLCEHYTSGKISDYQMLRELNKLERARR